MARITQPGFRFAGKSSDEMGVQLMQVPIIQRPERRGKSTPIPGYGGDLWEDENGAYSTAEITMECRTRPGTSTDDVSAWLMGFGDLIYDAEPQYSYRARITKPYDYQPVAPRCDARRFTVKVTVQPYRYLTNVQPITITGDWQYTNPGNTSSRPLITLYGSGDANLIIGTTIMMITGIDTSLVLDLEAQIAYKPGDPKTLRTGSITVLGDEWPVFAAGYVVVTWTGGITRAVIEPRWRKVL